MSEIFVSHSSKNRDLVVGTVLPLLKAEGWNPWYSDERQASYRVRRGGSWNDDARLCRSAHRIRFTPERRNFILGFRPVLTLASK